MNDEDRKPRNDATNVVRDCVRDCNGRAGAHGGGARCSRDQRAIADEVANVPDEGLATPDGRSKQMHLDAVRVHHRWSEPEDRLPQPMRVARSLEAGSRQPLRECKQGARAVCDERAIAHRSEPLAQREPKDRHSQGFGFGDEWSVASSDEPQLDDSSTCVRGHRGRKIEEAPLGAAETTSWIQKKNSHSPPRASRST